MLAGAADHARARRSMVDGRAFAGIIYPTRSIGGLLTPHDPLSAARGILNGIGISIFLWAMLLSLILGGCATSAPEDRGDGVCFLDGRCVPCEDLPQGCVYPMPKAAQ